MMKIFRKKCVLSKMMKSNYFFSNYKSFNNLREIRRFMDNLKPDYSCLYFTANWNPQFTFLKKNSKNK